MAERVGAEHHERLLTMDDLLDFLPRMVQLQDEPIADPVCVPVYYVSKLARDNGVIVVPGRRGRRRAVLGLPGVEAMLPQLQRCDDLPVPRVLKRAGVGRCDAAGQGSSGREVRVPAPRRAASRSSGAAPRRSRRRRSSACSHPAGATIRRAQLVGRDRADPAALRGARRGSVALNWMTYVDLNLRLPELLLMRVDKMSMGVSLEGRVPFLDHKFVELALEHPRGREDAERRAEAHPQEGRPRRHPGRAHRPPKQGFGVPVYEWFFDRLGDTPAASSKRSVRRPTSSTVTR